MIAFKGLPGLAPCYISDISEQAIMYFVLTQAVFCPSVPEPPRDCGTICLRRFNLFTLKSNLQKKSTFPD